MAPVATGCRALPPSAGPHRSLAVLYGWRSTTIDVDLKIVPEQDEILRAIPRLKDALHVNVELASPADFIPVRLGWEDRSPFIERFDPISLHHFDLYAQALAKVECGVRSGERCRRRFPELRGGSSAAAPFAPC